LLIQTHIFLCSIKYEGVVKDTDSKDVNMTQLAMDRYAYYVCFKCQKAYYGGEARCDAEIGEKFDPEELVCGGCSDVARAQMCPKHGTDFLEYKCRYCCSVEGQGLQLRGHFLRGMGGQLRRGRQGSLLLVPDVRSLPGSIPSLLSQRQQHQ